jgi:TRAP-type mannitol/chloroaromatic compound transport system permease small subunit
MAGAAITAISAATAHHRLIGICPFAFAYIIRPFRHRAAPRAPIYEQRGSLHYSGAAERRQGGLAMQALLAISRLIDALNDRVGRSVYWLVLLTVLVSAGNAIVRKVFNYSSNAYLELQWYLFSAIFLLCAGYALLNNNHVRIDILAGRLSAKGQAWIDILGTIFFLMPMVCVFIWLSIPWVYETRTDISGSAGGLILWPARILIPIGFTLLALQGISELIKRVAFVAGKGPDPVLRHDALAAEKALAEDIKRMAEGKTD